MLAYDAEGLFVTQTTNDLGHAQTALHWPSNGAVVVSRDPNGVDTVARYDGFGRPKAITHPDGTTTRIGYSAFEVTPGQPVGITIATDYGDGHRTQRSADELGGRVHKHAWLRWHMAGRPHSLQRGGPGGANVSSGRGRSFRQLHRTHVRQPGATASQRGSGRRSDVVRAGKVPNHGDGSEGKHELDSA